MTNAQTVLIVEDDEHWQGILKELLEDEGYDVTVIADYQYSRQALQKDDFDLVILDLELDKSTPTLEGKRLLNLISRRSLGIPCVVVSGQDDPQTIRDAFKKYHVVDYIAKDGFEIHTFLQAVQDALMPGGEDVVQDGPTSPVAPMTLRLTLEEKFDLEDIKNLCFDLGIDFDNLRGEGKKARGVVAHCRQHGRLEKLAARIASLRPGSL